MDNEKNIFLVGAGIMGSGIAEVGAIYGYQIYLYDVSEELLKKAETSIRYSLDKLHTKGVVKEDVNVILQRIKITTELSIPGFFPKIIIEAAPEDISIKKNIFAKLDGYYPGAEILATNTSSLSITEIATATAHPDKVIGVHFFNPPVIMKLVEIIPGMQTDLNVVEKVKNFVSSIEKVYTTSKDYPGFVTSRMLAVIINEAISMLSEGIATKEEIDEAIKLGLNHPVGPLTLADMVGLDTLLHILERLYGGYGNPKYSPHPLLYNMVMAGKLGKKSNEGFYRYSKTN